MYTRIKEPFKGFDQSHFILPDKMILLLYFKAELILGLPSILFTNVDKCVHRQLGTRKELIPLLQSVSECVHYCFGLQQSEAAIKAMWTNVSISTSGHEWMVT